MKGQKTGVGVRGALLTSYESNLLLLAVSGNKILLFGTPELILGSEVRNKATYNYILNVATSLADLEKSQNRKSCLCWQG